MSLLASLEDFAHSRGVTFDPTDEQAIIALEGASGVVRAYTGQMFDYVEDDEIILPGHGTRSLLLPELPVHEVSEVVLIGPNAEETTLEATDYVLDGPAGILKRVSGTSVVAWPFGWYWNYDLPMVRITHSHGYVLPGETAIEDVPRLPSELSLVTMQIAARSLTYAAQGGQLVASKSVGSFSVTYETDTSAPTGAQPLDLERMILDRYRQRSAI